MGHLVHEKQSRKINGRLAITSLRLALVLSFKGAKRRRKRVVR